MVDNSINSEFRRSNQEIKLFKRSKWPLGPSEVRIGYVMGQVRLENPPPRNNDPLEPFWSPENFRISHRHSFDLLNFSGKSFDLLKFELVTCSHILGRVRVLSKVFSKVIYTLPKFFLVELVVGPLVVGSWSIVLSSW